jgi:hypothetical protein
MLQVFDEAVKDCKEAGMDGAAQSPHTCCTCVCARQPRRR